MYVLAIFLKKNTDFITLFYYRSHKMKAPLSSLLRNTPFTYFNERLFDNFGELKKKRHFQFTQLNSVNLDTVFFFFARIGAV